MHKLFLGTTDIHSISREYDKLKNVSDYKINTRLGNSIVDYFTLEERLRTRGIKNISFNEYWENQQMYIDKWPCIQKLIFWCDCHNRYIEQPEKRAKYIFNLYFGSIQIFKPIVAMEIYDRFPSCRRILDPTMGWGGRLIGASIRDCISYTGIDSNFNLREPYNKMRDFLRDKSPILINTHFCDATQFDYSSIKYDMVFTSPPYEDIEKYSHMPTYTDWFYEFYQPLFRNTWEHLSVGGVYILNISPKIYKYAMKVLGEADTIMPYIKYERTNSYKEYFYIWKKII